jgi:hypothetical protein
MFSTAAPQITTANRTGTDANSFRCQPGVAAWAEKVLQTTTYSQFSMTSLAEYVKELGEQELVIVL